MYNETEIDQAFSRILDFYTCERRGRYGIFPSFSESSEFRSAWEKVHEKKN